MDKMSSVKEPQVSIGLGYVNSANTSLPKGGGGVGCGVRQGTFVSPTSPNLDLGKVKICSFPYHV